MRLPLLRLAGLLPSMYLLLSLVTSELTECSHQHRQIILLGVRSAIAYLCTKKESQAHQAGYHENKIRKGCHNVVVTSRMLDARWCKFWVGGRLLYTHFIQTWRPREGWRQAIHPPIGQQRARGWSRSRAHVWKESAQFVSCLLTVTLKLFFVFFRISPHFPTSFHRARVMKFTRSVYALMFFPLAQALTHLV